VKDEKEVALFKKKVGMRTSVSIFQVKLNKNYPLAYRNLNEQINIAGIFLVTTGNYTDSGILLCRFQFKLYLKY
jgi:hypothetical protein